MTGAPRETQAEQSRSWQEANRRELGARLARLRALVTGALGRKPEAYTEPATDLPSALLAVAQLFGLSPFERDLLLLCAGVELDAPLAALCAEWNGDARHPLPSFALALSVLPDAHWSALSPDSPLRHWELLRPSNGELLTRAGLRVDERILHFLAGVACLDARLEGVVQPLRSAQNEDAGSADVAHLAALLTSANTHVIALCGAERQSRVSVTAAAVARAGLTLFAARASDLPDDARERQRLARAWTRESILAGAVLLIEQDTDPRALQAACAFADCGEFPVVLSLDGAQHLPCARPVVRKQLEAATASEQRATWNEALGIHGRLLNGYVAKLSSQFSLPSATIRSAARDALTGLSSDAQASELERRLWNSCREQARPMLDDLAQRIDTRHTWDDLVLPEAQRTTLHTIVAHVAQRRTVHETWGFGVHTRGTGTAAVFAGGSGTGKTLAAEVLANELRLDLYRIDLSGVVSKYIGETEKNLRRIFAAAEHGGAILLFDEADAIFGKRSEVKDSHDRYANIEVSYLLQQMDSYRGLAILTTNLPENFDRAFLRRVRFIVQFPFPPEAQRKDIWARAFPSKAPTRELDVEKLARLNVSGGSIRNIALNAAFLAADESEPIAMSHLKRAAALEFAKLEIPLPDSQVADWGADGA